MDSHESVGSFGEQQLALLSRRSTFRVAATIIVFVIDILLLAAVAAPYVPRWQLLTCLTTQILLLAAYLLPNFGIGRNRLRLVIARLPRTGLFAPCEVGAAFRLRVYTATIVMLGVSLALALVFFSALPLLERIIVTAFLLLFVSFTSATTAGHRPLMYAFAIPILMPLMIFWGSIPLPHASSVSLADPIVLGVEITLVMTWIVVHINVENTRDLVVDSFNMLTERARLVRALGTSLADAEAANRAKTRFLASASHDLRQPIHAVGLLAAALEKRPLDARSHEMVHCITHALRDLSVELNALLDISKLDAGTMHPELSSIELRPVLLRLQQTFAQSAANKHLDLSLECPAGVWVYTDRNLLERIVRNLMENAIKYTACGRICIEVSTVASVHQLSIVDTGCGIPEAEQERVFEEFYQVDNAVRNRRSGLGLGLSIVKRLAELLGLALHMRSRLGQGTTFSLELPRSTGLPVSTSYADERWRSQLPQARVLVVDDEETVLQAMRAVLEEMSCTVISAASTDAALQAIATEAPDLLIADFRLPCTTGGLGTIAAIRAQLPGLPALLITGDTAPDRLLEAQTANIPVLHKPVSAEILQQTMAELLGSV